ncbi:MAG: acyl-CoA thioesterase II [Xanthomonadales bacterium]|nr:acyl-CoA thioesterase II [Gammaproteobacteria bacterium]MBT8054120.1 acyl-CoA thioesterase II [Gammaproteobacteria bacterium]NND56129.1 acyl-CoA thioesterase II [Xanthomonadales bacterium]NNK51644.1 acyl-CoA thioesterase II [Xanthomonadales bacterium]
MTRQSDAFDELRRLMELEKLEDNLFRGVSRDIGTERVFGGQVLAQALLAASRTVEGRLAHSLHAYFLRAGDHDAPIVYDVDRSRDGRSFSSRRVVAIQHGRPIFTLAASFQVEEQGLEHQFDIPPVPPPDDVEPLALLPREEFDHMPKSMQRWLDRFGPFEFRAVRGSDPDDCSPQPPFKELWFKLHGQLEEDPRLHRALLAYVSDFHLVGTATLPHGISWVHGNLIIASLDHAMWFHRDFRLDDWLLYVCDSPSSSGGRGLARGMIYDQKGRLVASTAQEGVIRLRRTDNEKESES